jgi:SAM-dependent methyltransferase
MTSSDPTSADHGYLHGHRPEERERLHRQARFLEPMVHDRLPFWRSRRLLEVGCGVGAQTAILLRNFPDLHVTGVDIHDAQLAEARRFLETVPWAVGRFAIREMDAQKLALDAGSFDGAFVCWLLEHVPDPGRVLREVRRILAPGAPIVCSEVLNATFFVAPPSPDTLRYWQAYNDRQIELGGDPFLGAKLGNLLSSAGFREVTTEPKTFHLDQRAPGERTEFLEYWSELLRSGAPALLEAGKVSQDVVDGMTRELDRAARDPQSVVFLSFIQARARA